MRALLWTNAALIGAVVGSSVARPGVAAAFTRLDRPDPVKPARRLRSKLRWLTARYDDGTMPPAGYASVRSLQIEIGFAEGTTHE